MPPEALSLDAWVELRMQDLLAREFDNALASIDGVNKVLGAQGFASRQEAQDAQPRPRRTQAQVVDQVNGIWWVYRHDPGPFWQRLQAADPGIFRTTVRWNHQSPAHFIAELRKRRAKPQTPLFDFIADLYGDKTGPGRTDVLPGVPRRELFDAFYETHGVEDGTCLYFGWAPRLS